MRTEIVLADEKESELVTLGGSVVAKAQEYAIIRDDPHREEARKHGDQIKRMRGLVADLFDEPTAQAHKLHKSLTTRRKTLDGPLEDAETAIKRGIGTYEANKQAAIEAQRRAAEAEARRMAQEAEAARQREIDKARKEAEDKRLAQAQALSDAGKAAEADAVMAAPVYVAPPPPPVPAPIVPPTPAYKAPLGMTVRKYWKFRVTVAELVPREWCCPDEKIIGEHVRMNEGRTSIPGIEVYADTKAVL